MAKTTENKVDGFERALGHVDCIRALEALSHEDAARIEPETPYIGREGEAITGRSEQDGRPESGGEVGAGRSFEATDAGQQALIETGDSIRNQIDELGDLDIEMIAVNTGRMMSNFTEVMDYLDESDRALARIQLCGGTRT